MNKPFVYIIILNWNGLDDTLECLDSLSEINYPNYDIVVIDNGSMENQGDVIKKTFPSVKLIKNEMNKGFVFANNQGIEIALKSGAEYILLLNNDTIVKHDFLDVLIEYAELNKDIGILSPKILYYDSDTIWSMGGRINYLTGFSIMIGKRKQSEKHSSTIEPDFITGCAMLIKKGVIEKIGLLDPIYFAYYEDVDFSYRTKNAGYKIMVNPQSIVWHKKSASAGIKGSNKITPMQAYLWAKNGIIFGRRINGLNKYLFLLGQISFRIIYGFVYSSSKKSIICYFRGIYAGFKAKI